MQEQKKIELSVALVEAIANYLARRPYIEVAQMIAEISKAVPTPQPQQEEVKKAA